MNQNKEYTIDKKGHDTMDINADLCNELLICGYLGSFITKTINIPRIIIELIESFCKQTIIPSLISFPLELSAENKQYLLYGFLRNLSPTFLISELVNLCITFYDEMYHWIINKEELTKLQDDGKLYSKIFKYQHFTLRYLLHKKINKFTKQMVFSKYIQLMTTPKYVDNIALYSEILCPINGDKWKSTRILSLKSDETGIGNIGSITEYEVNLNDVVLFDNIIKILRINMIKDTPHPVMINNYSMSDDIALNAITKFEWNVDREYLINCRLGQTIFSPNSENNTFTMQIRPLFREEKPNCLFGVRLLVLPYGIKKINTTVIYSNNNMDSLKKEWIFSYSSAGMGHIMQIEKLTGNEFADNKVINVVTVIIHQVYDMNDQLILRENWQNYRVYY